MPSRKHHNPDERESLESNEDVSVVPEDDMKPHKGFGKPDNKLKEELKAATIEKQKYLEGWQRAQADLINYRREAEKERKDITTRAVSTLIEELLPVLDSFDLAFGNKEAWEAAPKNWRDGVTYIHQQLVRTLAERDLETIDPIGEVFDPHEHESITRVPVAEPEKDGKILAVNQKGYRLKGKVIRPARVAVGHYEA